METSKYLYRMTLQPSEWGAGQWLVKKQKMVQLNF